METKYNLSSINASDEDLSTGEATYENLIRFKDADLQKLNKNPLNQVEKKLKKVYKKIEQKSPKMQESFVNLKILKQNVPPQSAKMPKLLSKI